MNKLQTKKWFKEVMLSQHEYIKHSLIKTIGGLIAFNYHYYEMINDGKKVNPNWVTIKDMIDENDKVNNAIRLYIEERLQISFGEISIEEYPEYMKELHSLFEYATREGIEKGKDVSKKNFANFLWFIGDFEDEIESVVMSIREPILKSSIQWTINKYKKEAHQMYRLSPYRMRHITDKINRVIENKRKELKAEANKPQLSIVKDTE